MTPASADSSKVNSSRLVVPEAASVYAAYQSLVELAKTRFAGELAGKLLLYGELDSAGAALALAGNIGGAATLGVDPDRERLKQGIHHGFCDFWVNNLDEALRILKNELRKKQPVSVCLDANIKTVLEEAVERGLQPDLLAIDEETPESAKLVERGTLLVPAVVASDSALQDIAWCAKSAAALWLPKVDHLLKKMFSAEDKRLAWLHLAPRYLGRTMAGRRYLQMTDAEADAFAKLVADATSSGEIGTEIMIQRGR